VIVVYHKSSIPHHDPIAHGGGRIPSYNSSHNRYWIRRRRWRKRKRRRRRREMYEALSFLWSMEYITTCYYYYYYYHYHYYYYYYYYYNYYYYY